MHLRQRGARKCRLSNGNIQSLARQHSSVKPMRMNSLRTSNPKIKLSCEINFAARPQNLVVRT